MGPGMVGGARGDTGRGEEQSSYVKNIKFGEKVEKSFRSLVTVKLVKGQHHQQERTLLRQHTIVLPSDPFSECSCQRVLFKTHIFCLKPFTCSPSPNG